uniref:cystathionine gamma-lyase n=1 Tax=Steinernema glaseri TaxID=37863 RepID=A0A1I7ZLD2_9BILA
MVHSHNSSDSSYGFSTRCLHAGQGEELRSSTQVVPPLSLSSIHKWDAPGELNGYEYLRCGNPTRAALEEALASLENAKYAAAYCSGLAAAYSLLSYLNPGDHIVVSDDLYGGVRKQLRQAHGPKHSLDVTFANLTNAESLKEHLKESTKAVWIESPSNPQIQIVDIVAIVSVAKKFNKDILVFIDSTFISPYFQKSLDLGVDAVMHSCTKYINGHSDVLMGCVMTNNEDIATHLHFCQEVMGIVPSTFDCYMANRGLKTLSMRMEKHMRNAMAIAEFLESHSLVEKVLYPGLPSHPQHAIHKKQSSGMSGMMAFFIRGELKHTKAFLNNLKVITVAESLGGGESLIEAPLIMTHRIVPEEDRIRLGITENMVRMSVGCEDVEDLLADLAHALKAMNDA